MPECIRLTVDSISQSPWLPDTCAYRRVAEGRALPSFHFLVSGNLEAIHEAGISIRYKAISENDVDTSDLELYVMD